MSRLCQRGALVFGLLVSLATARGQFSFTDQNPIGSFSGQFLVSRVDNGAPAMQNFNSSADTNVLQLKTALLAVSAERFKVSLWQQLGLKENDPWSGKIFLVLHPARSLDETVAIASSPFLNHWNYHVDLPDVLRKARYARALSGVLLLELANRSVPRNGHSAEVPAWLVDGMARQVLAADGEKVLLTAPAIRKGDNLPVNRINEAQRGFDSLVSARGILQNAPALTFEQLSWPTDGQMNGADGGVYYASAQLFLSELFSLKNGREKVRTMLSELPAHLNWQLAFLHAFAGDFSSSREVEKWWALRVVNFASRGAGPRWTTDYSLNRLQELLSIPVQFRSSSNALPTRADISLQSALRNLGASQREPVLRTRVRDLALAELRLAPPFGELADGYRVALSEFLGDSQSTTLPTVGNKHAVYSLRQASLEGTLKKLDALDARRRDATVKAIVTLQNHPKAAAD